LIVIFSKDSLLGKTVLLFFNFTIPLLKMELKKALKKERDFKLNLPNKLIIFLSER